MSAADLLLHKALPWLEGQQNQITGSGGTKNIRLAVLIEQITEYLRTT